MREGWLRLARLAVLALALALAPRLLWLFRLRNLAVRAETLEMMLLRDEVSESDRTLLAESKTLAASSDLTEE